MEETRVYQDAEWAGFLVGIADDVNRAFDADDHHAGTEARIRLFESFKLASEQRSPVAREQHTKGSRNEMIRAYAANGWYDEAIALAQEARVPQFIDRTCPNRPAVVTQALGRLQLEAGQEDRAAVSLGEAQALSEAFLALVHEGWALRLAGTQETIPPYLPPQEREPQDH